MKACINTFFILICLSPVMIFGQTNYREILNVNTSKKSYYVNSTNYQYTQGIKVSYYVPNQVNNDRNIYIKAMQSDMSIYGEANLSDPNVYAGLAQGYSQGYTSMDPATVNGLEYSAVDNLTNYPWENTFSWGRYEPSFNIYANFEFNGFIDNNAGFGIDQNGTITNGSQLSYSNSRGSIAIYIYNQ